MEHMDTAKLLRECDAGVKMAITSIDEVLEYVQDAELKKILQESKSEHQELEKEIDTLLSTHGMHEKEPHPVAKGMSWMKTNMKLAMNNSDQTIAVLVTDGCDMGINSLQQYLNQHENADHIAKGMCKKLISIEEKLRKDLKKYL